MIDFRSGLRRALLTYYVTHPSAEVYVCELAAQLQVDPSNMSRELSRLEYEGLFRSELRGKQRYYRLNRDYPLFNEVFSVLQRNLGAASAVLDALRKIPDIETAYLYGAFAKQAPGADSKIGVLIIGTPPSGKLASAMNRLETLLFREVIYTVLTAQELKEKLSTHDRFVTSIWNRKRVKLTLYNGKAVPATSPIVKKAGG